MIKQKHYLFWLKSSRGTDQKVVYSVPTTLKKEDIKNLLEEWCSGFGAWNVSENSCSYGFKQIKMPTRKELVKKYDAICVRKRKIEDEWKKVAAMLNPRIVA